jgi:hypothetical protein
VCALTWGEQKIFARENFFVLGEFFEQGGNFPDVVQGRLEAGQDVNLTTATQSCFFRTWFGTRVIPTARLSWHLEATGPPDQ